MAYIWINPVAERMYEASVLAEFLKRHELTQVRCNMDWGSIVKEKYQVRAQQAEGTLVDVRCPMASDLAQEIIASDGPKENSTGFDLPDIEPILIHCAREISTREDLRDGEKIITTPCRALADEGNALELPDTRFMTWNDLMESVGEIPPGELPKSSPIPPGFFNGLEVSLDSITGKETIEAYIKDGAREQVRLVEMLYCDQGCHNGDGVVKRG